MTCFFYVPQAVCLVMLKAVRMVVTVHVPLYAAATE